MEKRSKRIEEQRKLKRQMHIRIFDFILLPLVLLGMFGVYYFGQVAKNYHNRVITTQQAKAKDTKASDQRSKINKNDSQSVMRTPIDWHKPSEKIPYPDLKKVKDFWIKVSLKKNRTYLMSGNRVIYTMYSSGGMYHNENGKMVSYTPTGTFYIENERGDSFFNQSLNEGANYWISWKDHGVYLFHTVPTNKDGQYDVKEANKLGKQPASHGCIRLSIPDAKWMMDNLKVGTKVVVEN